MLYYSEIKFRKEYRLKFIHYLLLSFSLVIVNPVHAAWAGMTDLELINQSKLIIKATFIGKSIVSFPGTAKPSLIGILKVEQVYKGNADDVVLLLLPLRPPNVSVSTDILHTVGQNGLWFLKSFEASEGIYLVDHPQRIWSLEKQSKLKQLLATPAP